MNTTHFITISELHNKRVTIPLTQTSILSFSIRSLSIIEATPITPTYLPPPINQATPCSVWWLKHISGSFSLFGNSSAEPFAFSPSIAVTHISINLHWTLTHSNVYRDVSYDSHSFHSFQSFIHLQKPRGGSDGFLSRNFHHFFGDIHCGLYRHDIVNHWSWQNNHTWRHPPISHCGSGQRIWWLRYSLHCRLCSLSRRWLSRSCNRKISNAWRLQRSDFGFSLGDRCGMLRIIIAEMWLNCSLEIGIIGWQEQMEDGWVLSIFCSYSYLILYRHCSYRSQCICSISTGYCSIKTWHTIQFGTDWRRLLFWFFKKTSNWITEPTLEESEKNPEEPIGSAIPTPSLH